jgi:1,4-alpha-glucan branching enzyme
MKRNVILARTARVVLLAAAIAASAACFSGCFGGARPNAQRGGPEIVEGGVIFHFYDAKATRVNLVGDFNNWSPRIDAMVDENGDGEWTLYYTLAPGVYQYKFVVNGTQWIPDPRNPERVNDGFGGENSVLRVPSR